MVQVWYVNLSQRYPAMICSNGHVVSNSLKCMPLKKSPGFVKYSGTFKLKFVMIFCKW